MEFPQILSLVSIYALILHNEMQAIWFLVVLCLWLQCIGSTQNIQSVLIARCFSESDVHYIDEWLQYHIHVGFDHIIVIDGTVGSILEEYGEMYPTHLRLIVDSDYENHNQLVASLVESFGQSQTSFLLLNINEYLVLKGSDNVRSIDYESDRWLRDINCVFFGSAGLDKIDFSSSNPNALISRFTSRSNRYTGFTRSIYKGSEFLKTVSINEMFHGSQSSKRVVNISESFVAVFAMRTPEEFIISMNEIASRLNDPEDRGLNGLMNQYLEVLSSSQLESVLNIIQTKPIDLWLSVSKTVRHLDENSVPDFSLVDVQREYTGDLHNPTEWLNLIYNQPQFMDKSVTFAVDYELIEISERQYKMAIDHTVVLFRMQPDNIHRIVSTPAIESSIVLENQDDRNFVSSSDVDNNSVYCTLMHHLVTMYPRMKVSSKQLDSYMDGFAKLLVGAKDHLDLEAVKAVMLQDFNRYHERTLMSPHEILVNYQHEKRHETNIESCFTSYLVGEDHVLRKDFLMLVIHHDDTSLANIHKHLDLKKVGKVVPVRIDSSIFFEYVVYRDFLPDILPELESLKYVLVTTHSTLISVQPAVCGYEVSRLLSVAYQYDYDVVPLIRSKDWLLPTTINMHTRNFKLAWDALLTAMGYTINQIREYDYVTPFYRNSFIIKPHRLRELTLLMRRAIYIAQNHPVVNEVLSRPMGLIYIGTNSDEIKSRSIAQSIFNTSYYQLFPFVFERLPIFFLLSKGASVCQHNDDCYTPEPEPVAPLTNSV